VQFNIGDEVVVTGPTRCGSNAHIGKRFKITECDDIYFSTLDLPWFPWRSLELVPLKVGDWVEVVGVPSKIFQIDATDFSKWSGQTYYLDKERHQYPAKSLRKLAPEEALYHITIQPSEYVDASLEALEWRISAIEERLASVEQRLSLLERSQNGQSKYLVMKQWVAGP